MTEALEKRGERFHKAFVNRLARTRRERANPPPMMKKQNSAARGVSTAPRGAS